MSELNNINLNIKLLQRVGFKSGTPDSFLRGWHKDPNGNLVAEVPYFPDDLNACQKWLIPERISEITFMYASNCVSCDIEDLDGNFFEGHVDVESIEEAWTKSALALCLAIEKLIDSEVK